MAPPPARDPNKFNTPLGGLRTIVTKNGYVMVYIGTRGEMLHRMLKAQELGRPLAEDEQVHHDDENPLNNDLSNLVLTTKTGHGKFHKGPQGYLPRTRYWYGKVS